MDHITTGGEITSRASTGPRAVEGVLSERWGAALEAGYVAVPSVLLIHMASLKLSSTDLVVLLNVMSFQWATRGRPFPRVSTIARRINVTPRTVQRSLTHLRALGLIEWERVQVFDGKVRPRAQAGHGVRRRMYDLTPLVTTLATLATARKGFLAARPAKGRLDQIAA